MNAPQGMSHQALYRACMKEAAAQGRTLMQRVIERAKLDMPQHAARSPDVVERNLLAEAAKWLVKHEQQLCEAYPQALLAEFAHAIAGDARKAGSISFDGLELMGEEQVQENVELVRTQQVVGNAVQAELTELNALICAVQDLKSVQPERNPLRPEVYVRSLRTVTQQSPVPPSARRRWLLHLGAAMGPELARAYKDLCAILRAQGVTEAGFNITAVSGGPAPAAPPSAAQAAQQKTLLNVQELRRLLSGDLGAAPRDQPPPAPEFSPTMPAAFETLQELRQVDQVMQRLRQQGPSSDHANAQSLSREVVHLMVENIANDPRLLAPVQQAVRELEPALLRLASADPRFFSDKQHPARQLLEEMTQRSLAWASMDAPGFTAFLDPLEQAVEALSQTRTTGAEPFQFALDTLREAWGDAQRHDRRVREKAVRALLQAEQRNLLAEKITRELRGRADLPAAPPEIAHFITGPWSQVMAHARLADGSGAADPGGYGAVVPDLLWSTQPAVAQAQQARLVKTVPGLVEKLRRGLASIDYPPAQIERFLDHLAALHAQALKPAAPEPQRPVPLSTTLTREQLEAQFGEASEAGSWLAPLEAQHSGFMHTQPERAARPLFEATQPGFGNTQPQRPPSLGEDLPPLDLEPGAWIEMFDGSWSRWQLTWASPHGTLYMFTHGSGKTQSMTRRLLHKMLAAGTVRTVAQQTVVDGALDAVAQAALRNSI